MIALASDHGGYELKQKVIGYLEANGYTCHDSAATVWNPVIIRSLDALRQKQLQRANVKRESSSVQPVLVFRSLPTRFPVSAADFAQTPIPQK